MAYHLYRPVSPRRRQHIRKFRTQATCQELLGILLSSWLEHASLFAQLSPEKPELRLGFTEVLRNDALEHVAQDLANLRAAEVSTLKRLTECLPSRRAAKHHLEPTVLVACIPTVVQARLRLYFCWLRAGFGMRPSLASLFGKTVAICLGTIAILRKIAGHCQT